MKVRGMSVVAVMLCLVLPPITTTYQGNLERMNDDSGEKVLLGRMNDVSGVVVEELIPGSTAGNYSWVTWGSKAMCSPGSFAFAFQLKTEPIMLLGDFTSLNGILLYCMDRTTGRLDRHVTSTVGRWGLWGTVFMCTAGYLKGARMMVEQPWDAKKDKSAANNLAMECQDGERMVGDGTDRGQWGEWKQCPEGSAICGLATQVVPPQPIFMDDVSLISAAFYCCRF